MANTMNSTLYYPLLSAFVLTLAANTPAHSYTATHMVVFRLLITHTMLIVHYTTL